MITLIQPLPVGNALRLFYSPPVTAERWRILRRSADNFTGHDDAGAFLVHEGTDEVVLDITGIANGAEYFYRAWWWDGTQWMAGGVLSGTPESTQEDESVDALVLLRDRLTAGLAAEVEAGRLGHPEGKIRVLTAPPQKDDVFFPVVTVQLSQDAPGERFVGEVVAADEPVEGGFLEHEGWYSSVRLELVGWSFNPDERIELRKALKRLIIGNLPVFEAEGLRLVEFSQQDSEDFQTYNAPVYMTWGTFSCLAPSVVSAEVGEIAETITEIAWE